MGFGLQPDNHGPIPENKPYAHRKRFRDLTIYEDFAFKLTPYTDVYGATIT